MFPGNMGGKALAARWLRLRKSWEAEDLDAPWHHRLRGALCGRGAQGPPGVLLRILCISWFEFQETRVALRAASLTYIFLLSLVPTLAMSTAVLKGLGSGDQIRHLAYAYLNRFVPPAPAPGQSAAAGRTAGAADVAQDRAAGPSGAPGRETAASRPLQDGPPSAGTPPAMRADPVNAQAPGPGPELQSLHGQFKRFLDTVFDYVDKTNFTTLGALGIAALLSTVIMMFSHVEDALNAIWHAPQTRSFPRRMMNYLALLILLPISINLALAAGAVLESPGLLRMIHLFLPMEWLSSLLFSLLPAALIVLTLFVMYLFFPSVRVRLIPVLIGACAAGICWFLVQRLYISVQLGVSRYNAIYGSFASVPLFLLWTYFGWIFILGGAVLSFAVQNRGLYARFPVKAGPARRLRIATDIMVILYDHFARRRPCTVESLLKARPGERLGDLLDTLAMLERGGLVHRGRGEPALLLPTGPLEGFRLRDLVRLVFEPHPDQVLEETREDGRGVGLMVARRITRAAEKEADRLDRFRPLVFSAREKKAPVPSRQPGKTP